VISNIKLEILSVSVCVRVSVCVCVQVRDFMASNKEKGGLDDDGHLSQVGLCCGEGES